MEVDENFLFCDRYLNDESYFGGFEQHDLDQLYSKMKADFHAWVAAFAPAATAAGANSRASREFRCTFSSIRPEVAFGISQAVFESDYRSILPQV